VSLILWNCPRACHCQTPGGDSYGLWAPAANFESFVSFVTCVKISGWDVADIVVSLNKPVVPTKSLRAF